MELDEVVIFEGVLNSHSYSQLVTQVFGLREEIKDIRITSYEDVDFRMGLNPFVLFGLRSTFYTLQRRIVTNSY